MSINFCSKQVLFIFSDHLENTVLFLVHSFAVIQMQELFAVSARNNMADEHIHCN